MSWRLALRGVSVAAALSVAVACAKGEDGIELGAGGSSNPDAGADAARLPLTDGGRSDSGAKEPGDDDSGSGPGCTSKVVINELMPAGVSGAAEEFVELYNPNSCAVPLGGWKLAYKSGTGGGNGVLHTFATGDEIPAGSFLVLGTATFKGKKDATFSAGMATDGQVGLLDDTGTLIDGLGYDGATGEFVEGTAAPKPATNGSVGRKSDGLDTDNNASDCKAFSQHTAGAAN